MLAPRGSERSFLAPLSLADHLPIDSDMTARLKRFGLRTMADFAAMPLAAVEAQFGKEGLVALRLARGEDSRPLVPWEPPQRMEESSRLDPPVDNLEPLLFVARGLVDRLGTRLMEGGHAATVVRLQLELEDEAAAPEAILRLRAPMSTGEELWTPVATLLQRQPMTKPVSRVRLRLTGFCPAASRQMDLLARQDGRLEDISRQLMLLSDAHGPDLVRMAEAAPAPSLLDERRHRWTDPADALVRRTRATAPAHAASPRREPAAGRARGGGGGGARRRPPASPRGPGAAPGRARLRPLAGGGGLVADAGEPRVLEAAARRRRARAGVRGLPGPAQPRLVAEPRLRLRRR